MVESVWMKWISNKQVEVGTQVDNGGGSINEVDMDHSRLGYQKRIKKLKGFLKLLFTNNIYMKQT
jgi:hypothetical protein